MALEKDVKQSNGIVLNYHRIGSINKITNMVNQFEINSYINKEEREKEKRYQELQKRNANNEKLSEEEAKELEEGIDVMVRAEYMQIPYNETQTIQDVYDYLKTTEKYKDAKDA